MSEQCKDKGEGLLWCHASSTGSRDVSAQQRAADEMMVGMRSQLRHVTAGDQTYDALMFWCPGCERPDPDGQMGGGLHMLPVTGDNSAHPVWGWDGNLEAPTLSPSILTRHDYYTGPWTPPRTSICHSYLRGGVFEFLGDCTHSLAGQSVAMPELPVWAVDE